MTSRSQVLEGRRMPSPQAPLPREIPRVAIVDALQERFRAPVTTIVAGAGCGKTTVLAQAARSNLASPMGIDAWISCEPADEEEHRLTMAIMAALGVEWSGTTKPIDAITRAIVALAPLDVCLLLDDLHRLPTGSSGERLVADILGRLPHNGHLLLASRRPPPFALARRRASGEVLELGPERLVLSDEELAMLGALHRSPPNDVPDVGGWPALAALSFSAGGGSTTDYLYEEIVAGLGDGHRLALQAMIALGVGSFDDAVAVAGTPVSTDDIRHLIGTIPLVSGNLTTRLFSVHDLWMEQTDELFLADEVATTRAKARAVMIDGGHVLRLGSAALQWRDGEALLAAARALVQTRLIQLPVDTAQRWLTSAPAHVADEPDLHLLALALQVARRPSDPALGAVAGELIENFLDRNDPHGAVIAGTLAMAAAYRREDVGQVLAVAERLKATPGGDDLPIVRLVLRGAEATLAHMGGDSATAIRVLEAIDLEGVPSIFRDIVRLLLVNFLLEVGEAREAVRVASTVEEIDSSVAMFLSFIRWNAGQPTEAAARPPDLADLDLLDARSRFIFCSETADIAASLGLTDLARTARRELAQTVGTAGGAQYSAAAAAGMAKTLVLDHDEGAARAALNEHLVSYRIDDPLGDRGLRRHLATLYVLHEQLAERWDEVELGEVHRDVRELARLVGDARRGRLPAGSTIQDPELALTCLPLPWTVELAVAAHRDRVPGASALFDVLARYALGPTRSELQRLASGEAAAGRSAGDLLAELPDESRPPLRIGVLGPMSITLGQRNVESAELRRVRVRTVLTLLIVRGPMRRDELIEAVWPGRDLEKGRQNLRATLSRLRRLLQPDGDEQAGPQRLRTNGDVVSLAGPPAVDADLWELRRLVDAAGTDTTISGGGGPIESLRQAVALWRGSPVSDLESVAGFEGDIEQIQAEVIDACLRLGELLLTVGQFEEALRCADRARQDAPYSERAHRLALSAVVHIGDRARLQRRVDALLDMLDDLGVEPEPATSMLLARAGA